MNADNKNIDTPKKEWGLGPKLTLISQANVETKHLPQLHEHTGHFTPGGTFKTPKNLSSTAGNGAQYHSLLS